MGNILDYHKHCNKVRRRKNAIVNEITRQVIVAETLSVANEIVNKQLENNVYKLGHISDNRYNASDKYNDYFLHDKDIERDAH